MYLCKVYAVMSRVGIARGRFKTFFQYTKTNY